MRVASSHQKQADPVLRGKLKTVTRSRSLAAPEKTPKKKQKTPVVEQDAYDVTDLSGSEQFQVSLD